MTAATVSSAPSIWSRIAAALRGFGPTGALVFTAVIAAATFVETPIAALIVIVWALASRTKFRELGLVKPAKWVAVIAGGLIAGVVLKLAMKAVLMPLLGAPAINTAFHDIQTAPAGKLAFLVGYVIIGAGFCEEFVFRGYMFERFRSAGEDSWPMRIFTILFCATYFGALHFYPQGFYGALNAFFSGLITGTIFVLNGRRLWFLVFMHAAYDLAAIAIIYYGWENAVAHAFFR